MSKDYGKNKLIYISFMIALLCLCSWCQTAWANLCTGSTVTTTADSGDGSLRACIDNLNTNITFSIPTSDSGYQTNGSNHWWRITLASTLTITTNGATIDGTTQTTNVGDTNILGPEIEITYGSNAVDGLTIKSNNNTVRGFIINGFSLGGAGIRIDGGTGNTIAGNYIGTDFKGTLGVLNSYGVIMINGASSNTIGGTALVDRNTISCASAGLIYITGAGTNNNRILGNYIGTSAGGANFAPFTACPQGIDGIMISGGAQSTTIGGGAAGAGNVISRLNNGISISDPGTNSHTIQGNYIGTNAAGSSAITNLVGVYILNGAQSTTIGGTAAGAGNVISGNTYGIAIEDPNTNSHVIQGNYIGTDHLGTSAIPNDTGIYIFNSAQTTTIGGTVANARNVISGNTTYGIDISDSGTNGHFIQGNYIGTKANGLDPLPNGTGVYIENSAAGTTIGGADSNGYTRNVISGNTQYGIQISGANNHLIQGNYIGTDNTGAAKLANSNSGVYIGNGAGGTTIGGTVANAGNVISGNTQYGIYITGATTTNHLIQGNYIGTNAANSAAIKNGNSGVYILGSANHNTIGGIATATAANHIAYNGGAGIALGGTAATTGNIFSANSIFTNDGVGISLGSGPNGSKPAPTILSITTSDGITSVVTATVPAAGDTIQFFRANNASGPAVIPDVPAGEGYLFLGSCVDNGGTCVGPYVSGSDTNGAVGTVSVTLTLGTSGGLTWGDTLSATATDGTNGTSPFCTNKVVSPKLIKQTYDMSGTCLASSPSDATCNGGATTINVPAGMALKFMIIVNNKSASAITDVRFQDLLDTTAGTGFTWQSGMKYDASLSTGATLTAIYNAVSAGTTQTDGLGDDYASYTAGNPGTLLVGGPGGGGSNNNTLSIAAGKIFVLQFLARKN